MHRHQPCWGITQVVVCTRCEMECEGPNPFLKVVKQFVSCLQGSLTQDKWSDQGEISVRVVFEKLYSMIHSWPLLGSKQHSSAPGLDVQYIKLWQQNIKVIKMPFLATLEHYVTVTASAQAAFHSYFSEFT